MKAPIYRWNSTTFVPKLILWGFHNIKVKSNLKCFVHLSTEVQNGVIKQMHKMSYIKSFHFYNFKNFKARRTAGVKLFDSLSVPTMVNMVHMYTFPACSDHANEPLNEIELQYTKLQRPLRTISLQSLTNHQCP